MQCTAAGLSAALSSTDLGFTPTRVWNPSPSVQHRTEPYELPQRLVIGVRGTEETSAKYSPPPFAVVVENDTQSALVSVSADPGWHRWNHLVFEVSGAGASVAIDLEGSTIPAAAAEHLRLHALSGTPDESRHALLARGLRAQYATPGPAPQTTPGWWSRPIYCGWGDQVTTAMLLEGQGPERRALTYCIQGLYERWVARLEAAEVPMGTVIIDAGWSPAGYWEPTPTCWPDLRRFVDTQHARGRKVLLWLATWMFDGLPESWCIQVNGQPITADPTNPEYLDHVRRQVHRLLGPDGFDADGFKIDQLSYCPTRRAERFSPRFGWSVFTDDTAPLVQCGDGFGCELLHLLQKTIYDAAKESKPDALVTSSTVHPYFHDTLDMVRIHDMGAVAADIFAAMRARVELAHAALPNKLIDADDWIHSDYALWQRYTSGSHVLGVPCIFYAEHFMNDWHGATPTLPIPMADLEAIGDAWRAAGY